MQYRQVVGKPFRDDIGHGRGQNDVLALHRFNKLSFRILDVKESERRRNDNYRKRACDRKIPEKLEPHCLSP